MKHKMFFFMVVILVLSSLPLVPTFGQSSTIPQVVTMPDQIAEGRDVSITISDKPAADQPTELEIWEAQVAAFESMYPNVSIEGLEQKYDPVAYLAMLAGDQLPTIFNAYFTEPEKFISQNAVADLTSLMEESGASAAFNPNVLGIASQDGAIYGLPDFAYSLGLAYNIEMLNAAGYDAPPATWEELEEMAVALTDAENGIAGFAFINDGSGATGWHFTNIAYGFGATPEDIIQPNGDGTYTAHFGEGATADAMQFVQKLQWEDGVLPGATLDWVNITEALASERVAMVIYAGDQFEFMKNQFPDADLSKFGYAPVPAGPNGRVALTGGSLWMIDSAASEDEIEAAFYFQLWRQFDPTEYENSIVAQHDAGRGVGRPVLPLYVGEFQQAREDFEAQYNVLPVENYVLFTDAVKSGELQLQAEPPAAAQDYYAEIGILVSEVLSDQSVDAASRLSEIAEEFQAFVLD